MDWSNFLSSFVLLFSIVHCDELASTNSDLYTVEGKVFPPDSFAQGPLGNWQIHTRVLANGGEYVGFLKCVLIIQQSDYFYTCMYF